MRIFNGCDGGGDGGVGGKKAIRKEFFFVKKKNRSHSHLYFINRMPK